MLAMSAEIAAARARLETVLARLELAEQAAGRRGDNQRQEETRSNHYQGRRIQFDDSHEEEDHVQHCNLPQGWIYLSLVLFSPLKS